MNVLKHLFHKMRALPEVTRHLLAAGSMLISSLLLVLVWGLLTSSDLNTIGGKQARVPQNIVPTAQTDTALSPSAGISESVKGIMGFIGSQIAAPEEEGWKNWWSSAFTQIKIGIAGRRAFFSEKLQNGFDAAMQFMYDRMSRHSMSSELNLDQK